MQGNRKWQWLFYGLLGGIIVSCLSFGWLFYCERNEAQAQRYEAAYWQDQAELLKEGRTEAIGIPSLKDLPAIIEVCCVKFQEQGVQVRTFNIESFSTREAETGLDYALLRLQLWSEPPLVQRVLQEIEEKNDLAIHIQEVISRPEESEVLLRIYLMPE
ncbi:MAG: hypothetical protein LBT22_07860 [Peptococcaceae bacterium]|jgi:hypothetical protein|nr:hypothetical protein [Peptococcaceae bacterium]